MLSWTVGASFAFAPSATRLYSTFSSLHSRSIVHVRGSFCVHTGCLNHHTDVNHVSKAALDLLTATHIASMAANVSIL